MAKSSDTKLNNTKHSHNATTSQDASRLLAALNVVASRLQNKAAKQGERAQYLKYSPIDFQALRWIAATARPTPGGLAKYLDVAPTTATSLLDRLADKDLIAREPSTRDRRKIALSLTARGRRAVTAIAVEDRANCAVMLDVLDADAREDLLTSLELIAGHIRPQSTAKTTNPTPVKPAAEKTEKSKPGRLGRREKPAKKAAETPIAKPAKMATDRVKPSRP